MQVRVVGLTDLLPLKQGLRHLCYLGGPSVFVKCLTDRLPLKQGLRPFAVEEMTHVSEGHSQTYFH